MQLFGDRAVNVNLIAAAKVIPLTALMLVGWSMQGPTGNGRKTLARQPSTKSVGKLIEINAIALFTSSFRLRPDLSSSANGECMLRQCRANL